MRCNNYALSFSDWPTIAGKLGMSCRPQACCVRVHLYHSSGAHAIHWSFSQLRCLTHMHLKASYICFFSKLPSERKTAEFWVHQYPARLARRQLQTLAADETQTLLLPLPVAEPVAQLSRMQPMQGTRSNHVSLLMPIRRKMRLQP